jgi:exopolysaccharide biosynthesis polyprenyl glycosylphosphotransferase
MNALPNAQLPTENVVPPYARMIPGSSTLSFPQSGMTGREAGSPQCSPKKIPGATPNEHAHTRALIHWLLPQSLADPFALYQPVLIDLFVLTATCGLLTVVSPLWSTPPILIPTYAVLVTLFSFTEGLYGSNSEPLSARIVPPLGRSSLFAAVLVFVASDGDMLVRAFFSTFLSSLGSLFLWRLLKHYLDQRFVREAEKRNVLIVGGGPLGESIARALRNQSSDDTVVCGFLDDDLPLSPAVLGRIDDLEWLARAEFVDEVILALPDQPERTRQAAAIALHNHLDLRAVPDLPPACWPHAVTDRIGDVPVVTLHRESLPSASLFLKRLLDVAAAAFGMLLLSPLMAAIALLIRLDSPGPAFYAAERTGAKGCRFRCFKFRSMVAGSDHMKEILRHRNQREGPIFKIEGDPRITHFGHFLRRYSLDELPQLWNVLRGEMSLVGPRPHPVDDVNRYELHHYRRLDVKPGITGLWQITARKSPSFELNMHLDLIYIENWSLLLDFRILVRTARVLFAPEGD